MKFLNEQYDQIITSGAAVSEVWRSSRDRFIADLWDITPLWRNHRFLAFKDESVGFAPDNVEWHFEKPVARTLPPKPKPKQKPKPRVAAKAKPKLTPEQIKQIEIATREERRRKLAALFQRWEKARRTW